MILATEKKIQISRVREQLDTLVVYILSSNTSYHISESRKILVLIANEHKFSQNVSSDVDR